MSFGPSSSSLTADIGSGSAASAHSGTRGGHDSGGELVYGGTLAVSTGRAPGVAESVTGAPFMITVALLGFWVERVCAERRGHPLELSGEPALDSVAVPQGGMIAGVG
jgi:hypothetical protein